MRRYYVRNQRNLINLELTFKQIPILILLTDELTTSNTDMRHLASNLCTIQERRQGTYHDLKKRIADCVNHSTRNQAVTQHNIRLWECELSTDLKGCLQQVAASLQRSQPKAKQGSPNGATASVEENSGVDFPGKSLEPFVGSVMTLEEKQFG